MSDVVIKCIELKNYMKTSQQAYRKRAAEATGKELTKIRQSEMELCISCTQTFNTLLETASEDEKLRLRRIYAGLE